MATVPPSDPVVRPVVSVDDHVIESSTAFVGRVPARFAGRAPRMVETDAASLRTQLGEAFDKWDPERNTVVAGAAHPQGPRQAWQLDGALYPIYGMDSCVGRPAAEWSMRPLRLDEMIPGSWDPVARLRDMDTAGIWASLNFPSMWVGFCGTTFLRVGDAELGLALVRAWNRWYLEEWVGAAPDRFIPIQLPCLWDAELAAGEVRRNAALGLRAVSFSERPSGLGLRSIHTGYWDPFFQACEETETVVCLHGGSSGSTLDTSPDAPLEVAQSLFPAGAIMTAVDWVWSRVPVRFPGLRIALSEGGVGWLPLAMDWMDHTFRMHNDWTHGWDGVDLLPSEVLLRNFWFCTIDEPRGVRAVASGAGIDKLTLEVDYPHADSTWPRTQDLLRRLAADLTADQLSAVAYANACELFNLPPPPGADPSSGAANLGHPDGSTMRASVERATRA